MKKIKFKLEIEKSFEGSYPLEEVLDWFEMTEEEWNALTQEQQENLMHDFCEDVVCDIDSEDYHSMSYNIKIIK